MRVQNFTNDGGNYPVFGIRVSVLEQAEKEAVAAGQKKELNGAVRAIREKFKEDPRKLVIFNLKRIAILDNKLGDKSSEVKGIAGILIFTEQAVKTRKELLGLSEYIESLNKSFGTKISVNINGFLTFSAEQISNLKNSFKVIAKKLNKSSSNTSLSVKLRENDSFDRLQISLDKRSVRNQEIHSVLHYDLPIELFESKKFKRIIGKSIQAVNENVEEINKVIGKPEY